MGEGGEQWLLSQRASVQFPVSTCCLTTICGSSPGNLKPSSRHHKHQACTWYTCIYARKHSCRENKIIQIVENIIEWVNPGNSYQDNDLRMQFWKMATIYIWLRKKLLMSLSYKSELTSGHLGSGGFVRTMELVVSVTLQGSNKGRRDIYSLVVFIC